MSENRNGYAKSMEMEFFLKGILNVKPDSRADQDLKDFYRNTLLYEEGFMPITCADARKRYRSLMRYFSRAMDKLAKKSTAAAAAVEELRAEIPNMSTAADMLYLYERLKPFRK